MDCFLVYPFFYHLNKPIFPSDNSLYKYLSVLFCLKINLKQSSFADLQIKSYNFYSALRFQQGFLQMHLFLSNPNLNLSINNVLPHFLATNKFPQNNATIFLSFHYCFNSKTQGIINLIQNQGFPPKFPVFNQNFFKTISLCLYIFFLKSFSTNKFNLCKIGLSFIKI